MQLTLLDAACERPKISQVAPTRHQLDETAWVDVQQGFVSGHAGLFQDLHASVRWEQHRRRMFDRYVDVPRLTSRAAPRLPVIDQMASALGLHYGERLCSTSLALYRDGRDSVAWHADTELDMWVMSTVALVILGEPRPFMVRPKSGGGSLTFRPGWGDLIVMGGSCQRGWEHCVPKVRHAGPRMSVMFRPANDATDSGRRKQTADVRGAESPRRL